MPLSFRMFLAEAYVSACVRSPQRQKPHYSCQRRRLNTLLHRPPDFAPLFRLREDDLRSVLRSESNPVLPRANTQTADKGPPKNFCTFEAAVTSDFFET
jgi:hypothetical protein